MSVVMVRGEQQSIAELAASKRELVTAITKAVDFYVDQFGLAPQDAAERARTIGVEAAEHKTIDQVTWADVAALLGRDHDRGVRLWDRLKDEAEHELMTGARAARSLELPGGSDRPLERAQFFAILRSLTESVQPRDTIETLIVQQIAMAMDRHLTWQGLATRRMAEAAWEGERDRRRALETMTPREKERYQDDYGWLPPRTTAAEAIDQAVMIADRFQRQFMRLLKALRDQRRLFDTLVVTGGQVNVSEQQVVMPPGQRPPRQGKPPRRNAQPKGA